MIMNKNGFTLVELLATMVILAIISAIAIPNVVKIMVSNKKEKVLNDGLTLIAQAKKKVTSDIDLRNELDEFGREYNLQNLDKYSDLVLDPDGKEYNRTGSYVKISKINGVITYCVYLESDGWKLINGSSCVLENELLSDNSKNFIKEN